MSCPSSQNPLILTVGVGNLPEGFCPATLQELANEIVARIIISPSEASLNIVGGGTEPASNVGPWFKNCEQLFVFNDTLARYIPVAKGGFSAQQVFTASGDFTVPENVYKIMAEGNGGGGAGYNGASVGPGGGGGWGMIFRDVVPGQVIPVVVGMGGTPGSPGTAGGNSSIMGMTMGGGAAGDVLNPGAGGVVTGADNGINGGVGVKATSIGGFGGSSPRGGAGGGIDDADHTKYNGVIPGGGGTGGGAPTNLGGDGARGVVLVWY